MKSQCSYIVLLGCLFITFNSYSQNSAKDTTLSSYSDNDKHIIYSSLQAIIAGNQPLSYFAWMPQFCPVERPIPLKHGEGYDGYLFEGNMDQCFPLFQGRDCDNYFLQTMRISFRYAPAVRFTYDEYNYLIPSNQKIGGQLDKVIWDSYTNNLIRDKKSRMDYDFLSGWNKSKAPLHMIYMTLTGLHYSNGLMLKGIYLDTLRRRNNYQSGFFATNYFQLMTVYSYFNKKLLSAGLGYQYDFGGMTEQINRYGQQRILLLLQSRSKPRTAWFNLIPQLRTIRENDMISGKKYLLKRLWEHRVRLEAEYIAGNLSEFKRSGDYRLSMHFYYEIMPMRSRSVGVMFHAYYGRDYFNIRYDDIVYAVMGGFTFHLDQFRLPRFNANEYLVHPQNN